MSEQRFDDKGFVERGGPAASDAGAEKVGDEHKTVQGAHARAAEATPEGEKHDQLAKHEEQAEDRQEALIDEGVEETFPASDPVSAKRIT